MATIEQAELAQKMKTLVDAINADVARMMNLINVYLNITTGGGSFLPVPWMSQLGSKASYGSGDCAEACVAMVLSFLGKKIDSVDQVSKAAGLPQGFTSSAWWDAVKAAGAFGVVLEHAQGQTLDNLATELKAGRPVIVLVDYPSIPNDLKYDSKYNSGHFLVVVGMDDVSVFVNDPYWPDDKGGANIIYPRAAFFKAWSTPGPGHGILQQALYVRMK